MSGDGKTISLASVGTYTCERIHPPPVGSNKLCVYCYTYKACYTARIISLSCHLDALITSSQCELLLLSFLSSVVAVVVVPLVAGNLDLEFVVAQFWNWKECTNAPFLEN